MSEEKKKLSNEELQDAIDSCVRKLAPVKNMFGESKLPERVRSRLIAHLDDLLVAQVCRAGISEPLKFPPPAPEPPKPRVR